MVRKFVLDFSFSNQNVLQEETMTPQKIYMQSRPRSFIGFLTIQDGWYITRFQKDFPEKKDR